MERALFCFPLFLFLFLFVFLSLSLFRFGGGGVGQMSRPMDHLRVGRARLYSIRVPAVISIKSMALTALDTLLLLRSRYYNWTTTTTTTNTLYEQRRGTQDNYDRRVYSA